MTKKEMEKQIPEGFGYTRIDDMGIVKQEFNGNKEYMRRQNNWSCGGIFRNKEEAERYKQFREDILSHSYEFSDKEWSNPNISKWYIRYDYGEAKFAVNSATIYRHFNEICYKTEEEAQYIIDNYNEELKKGWKV